MPRHRSLEPVFTVLLVCTGNICRSALAERLGRAYLHEVLAESAGVVQLMSAGVQAVAGSAITRTARWTCADWVGTRRGLSPDSRSTTWPSTRT